jgi:hypothetical protein
VFVRIGRADALAGTGYLAAALWVTARLWLTPGAFVHGNPADQAFFEWVLAHGARVVTHLENPFFTTRLNPPAGVNMMANTSVLGLSIPAAPLTLLAGAHVTFLVLLTIGLSGTGYAWYLVLSRHLGSSRGGAFLGGALCGFGPGMIAHAQGHLNLVSTFLVPFIVLRLLRLARPHRSVRAGVPLGLLLAYQVLVNEEVLFITGLAVAGFALVLVPARPDLRRIAVVTRAAATLLVAVTTALTLVGYPLWIQFFGPRHYHGIMPDAAGAGTPLDSYLRLPVLSLARHPTLSANGGLPVEDNACFGPGLMAVILVYTVHRGRDPVVRAVGVTALVLAVLAVGLRGPYRLLARLPLVDSLVAGRLTLAVLVIVGILFARAWDDLAGRGWPARAAVVAVALLPIVPIPLPVFRPAPVPAFITGGAWQRYVDGAHTMVTVPPTTKDTPNGMRLAAVTNLGFRLANGYFLGPAGGGDQRAAYGPAPRSLTRLLLRVRGTGTVPAVTEADRRAAVEDLRYWRAAVVVLPPGYREDPLRRTVDLLLGPGTRIGGAWIWDVRGLVP